MPLPEHKLLVLRLIATEQLRARPGSPNAAREEHVAQRISQEFLDDAGASDEYDSPQYTVQDLVSKQLKRVAPVRALFPAGADREFFDYLHKLLKQRVGQGLCKKCVGTRKQLACKDDASHDDRLLDEKGLCIADINACFNYLQAHVKKFLDKWGYEEGVKEQPLEIQFCRGFIGGPRGGGRPKTRYRGSASGATVFQDEPQPGKRRSRITLELDGRFFDWKVLLSLPWLMTHELVCHAHQGRAGLVREPCERDCPFYEGWMDEVAAHVLEEIVVRRSVVVSGVERPVLLDLYAKLVANQGEDFRRWRYQTDDPGRGTPETTWELGQMAALHVLNFFHKRVVADEDYDAALGALVRLSMRIQRRDPTKAQAREIALKLGSLGAYGARNQCPADACRQIRDLMNSSMETTSWIEAMQACTERLIR